MKPTKHATTNYRALKPFLDGLGPGSHRRYTSGEYMPLVVEKLYQDGDATVYSLTHYGEQNGGTAVLFQWDEAAQDWTVTA